MSNSNQHSQFSLFTQRRFAPFFATQFFGAANDNLMKFALTVMVTYQIQLKWLPPAQAGLVIGALFIAPFLLFSATSGQLTDKYPKHRIIVWLKTIELGITVLAAYGFYASNIPVLLFCVFGMGLQSTLFGPVKYALLPQVLKQHELTGGNGLVEMGTFVAILLGNMAGGLLISLPQFSALAVAISCGVLAIVGWFTARLVPALPASAPDLTINPNPFSETWRNLQLAKQYPSVFRSILGISWMWFVGAVFLSQFPSLSKDVLHGNEHVASLLLVVFSCGIGFGSLMCERLSRGQVEIGLVPLGALGMTVGMVDLFFALSYVSAQVAPAAHYSLGAFIAMPMHWRVLADLFILAMSAGIFSVPMYALIQWRCPESFRARIIATNNIMGSLFMITSAVMVGALLHAGFSIAQTILLLAVMNIAVSAYIFMLVPEYLIRLAAWLLSTCVYRFKVQGREHIPSDGAAIVACNHVSFADAVLLMSASPRPIYFLMDHQIFKTPVLGWLFRASKAIPICSPKQDIAIYEAAMQRAAEVLQAGDVLGIFPEGRITSDGNLGEFKQGIMTILKQSPAPVIPMALQNLWGSYFSRIEGQAMTKPLRRGWLNRVGLHIGQIIPAQDMTVESLKSEVERLYAETI